MKRFFCCLMAATMLFGLCACTQPGETTGPDDGPGGSGEVIVSGGTITTVNSGNNRAFYHIFVGSFSDSNGDGTGDLRGIIQRFDYLNDGDDNSGLSLGVEGIWLSPIFTSPSYHKYDVTNYYEIDPKFGTMDDLVELIELCHSRNVKIILDMVINHSAKNNVWFQNFAKAHRDGDTSSEYYDFYTWTETPTAGATWYPISGSNHYYEGNFSSEMPEMNFENEFVRQTMVDAAKYYLDMGVDGFRFDAAKYIYYGETTRNTDFWVWYMQQLRAIKPDIYTVAEVWDSDAITIPYFSSTNCFNFTMSQTSGIIAETARAGNVNAFTGYLESYLAQIQAQRTDAALVAFIANHDTDRAAGFLTVASGQAKVAANLALLLPGSTFIDYGEEIGMKGSRGGSNTDANRRLAMLWGDGDTVKDPVGANYTAEQTNGTVADQLSDPDSLYNHYKKLILLRKAYPEIVYGTFTALETDAKWGGFISTLDGSTVVVLHNTSGSDVTVDLSTLGVDVSSLEAFVGMGNATLEGNMLTIAAQTSVILK